MKSSNSQINVVEWKKSTTSPSDMQWSRIMWNKSTRKQGGLLEILPWNLEYFHHISTSSEVDTLRSVPSLNPMSRLLVVSHWIPRGMLHPTAADNQTAVCWCRPPLIPTEQTLHNYKQCQTHSYPVVSSPQRHAERHSLSDSLETDSVCALISHLPRALCPWPRCVSLSASPKLAAHDRRHWYTAILR